MLKKDIKDALLTAQLCEYLDQAEVNRLSAHSEVVNYSKGETILQQGKVSNGIYIIMDGTVSVTAKILGEGISQIATLHRGHFLGEISSIEKGPCATSATAETAVECLLITNAYFDMLTLFYPETKYKIMRAIAEGIGERLKHLHKKITAVMSDSEIATQSLFGKVIDSLTHPSAIDFAETGITLDQLRLSTFFKLFTHDEFDELFKHANIIRANKHSSLIQMNEKNAPAYIILRGAVQSSIVHDNKVAKLFVLGPMNFFCSLSMIDEHLTSIVNYTACERAILLKLDKTELDLIQKSHRHLWYKIFDLIGESFVVLERSADELDVRLNSELFNR